MNDTKSKRGRPKIHNSEADRKKAYRDKKKEEAKLKDARYAAMKELLTSLLVKLESDKIHREREIDNNTDPDSFLIRTACEREIRMIDEYLSLYPKNELGHAIINF